MRRAALNSHLTGTFVHLASPEHLHYMGREKVLDRKHVLNHERWSRGTKSLPPLGLGEHVLVQNQTGPKAKKLCLSGTVVEVGQNDSYVVRMDGSGRLSKRRRQFLRRAKSFDLENISSERDVEMDTSDEMRRSERLRGRGGHSRT